MGRKRVITDEACREMVTEGNELGLTMGGIAKKNGINYLTLRNTIARIPGLQVTKARTNKKKKEELVTV